MKKWRISTANQCIGGSVGQIGRIFNVTFMKESAQKYPKQETHLCDPILHNIFLRLRWCYLIYKVQYAFYQTERKGLMR